jgi:hypothetical protein
MCTDNLCSELISKCAMSIGYSPRVVQTSKSQNTSFSKRARHDFVLSSVISLVFVSWKKHEETTWNTGRLTMFGASIENWVSDVSYSCQVIEWATKVLRRSFTSCNCTEIAFLATLSRCGGRRKGKESEEDSWKLHDDGSAGTWRHTEQI